jgi:TonB family protein
MFDKWTSVPTESKPGLFLSITLHTLFAVFLLQTHSVIRNPHLHMGVVETTSVKPLWMPVAPSGQPRSNPHRRDIRRTSVPPNVRLFTPNENLTAADEGAAREIDPSLNLAPELNISQEVLQTRLKTMQRVAIEEPVLAPPAAPAIATNPEPPPPLRIGGQVEPAKLIKQVVPVYPPMARSARVEGVVTVDAIIQPSGKLTELKVVDGHPLLIEAALEALRQWRYTPAKLNGAAVDSPVHINVIFRLVFPGS